MRLNKLSLAILAAVVSLAAGAAACAAPAKSETEAVAAPEFSLKDLQGFERTLASYKGKVLFLNFWATWCPPCRAEIPDFIEAYRELKDQGLEILGVSVDEMSEATLLEWAKNAGLNYPVALATSRIYADYRPGDYIPATIVVDREGMIRHRQSRLMDKETLVRLFKEYSK
jgi:peroxiredoxin